ncbi:hypothetical protein ACFYQT_09540 [Streptomyces tibetensis]|uniref:Uncharacterized protein n=1 Tax=Streptomyces tibetensis TaxID=2382123 RepID=A0ABW6MTD0_9ACTN
MSAPSGRAPHALAVVIAVGVVVPVVVRGVIPVVVRGVTPAVVRGVAPVVVRGVVPVVGGVRLVRYGRFARPVAGVP